MIPFLTDTVSSVSLYFSGNLTYTIKNVLSEVRRPSRVSTGDINMVGVGGRGFISLSFDCVLFKANSEHEGWIHKLEEWYYSETVVQLYVDDEVTKFHVGTDIYNLGGLYTPGGFRITEFTMVRKTGGKDAVIYNFVLKLEEVM